MLTPAGRFVLGDYFVPRDEERRCLLEYRRAAGDGAISPGRLYHLDIPCSVPTEIRLLRDAGFSEVQVTLQAGDAAVLVAR